MARRALAALRRRLGRSPDRRPDRPPDRPPDDRPKDPFAGFRSLEGPRLVSGPATRHAPELDRDPRVVVLLPHLDVGLMSGGPNTVLQIAARLLRHDLRLRFVATSGALAPDAAAVRAHLELVTGVDIDPGAVDFVQAAGSGASVAFGRGDVPLATWWPTAHTANAALAHVSAPEFLYVVQDFEPGFHPWSSKYALAEATYAMPMRAIVNEPLLERHLRAVGSGRFADTAWGVRTFMPAVDRTVFARRPVAPPDRPRRLVFYARPQNPRNLFEIGLRVLRETIARGVFGEEPWEFVSVGRQVPDLPLPGGHVLHAEPWRSYQSYGELLGTSDVLLSLMLSPHTSYPPLEMATAGGLVVTNTFGPKTAEALAAISPSIRGAAPAVEPLVAALAAAVRAIRADGLPVPATSLPPTWDEALLDVVPWVAQQVAELRRS